MAPNDGPWNPDGRTVEELEFSSLIPPTVDAAAALGCNSDNDDIPGNIRGSTAGRAGRRAGEDELVLNGERAPEPITELLPLPIPILTIGSPPLTTKEEYR
jgi:hypothetical protein